MKTSSASQSSASSEAEKQEIASQNSFFLTRNTEFLSVDGVPILEKVSRSMGLRENGEHLTTTFRGEVINRSTLERLALGRLQNIIETYGDGLVQLNPRAIFVL